MIRNIEIKDKEEWEKLGASKADMGLHEDFQKLHELLKTHLDEQTYNQAVASLKNSVLTAFYTPEVVPQALFDVLKKQGIHPESVYEPSAGAGVFVKEATKAFPKIQHITAVEKDLALLGRLGLEAKESDRSTPSPCSNPERPLSPVTE